MKLLYTNHGILTPTRVRQLLECGMDIQVAGPAGEIAGVVEGGPSTRRASKDAAIDADMADFGDLDREEREAQELADLMADDDFHRRAFFLDDEKDDDSYYEDDEYDDGFTLDWIGSGEYSDRSKPIPGAPEGLSSLSSDSEERIMSKPGSDLDEARDLDDPNSFGDEPSDEDMFLGGTDSLDPSVEDAIALSRAHDTKGKDFIGPEEDDDFEGHTFSDEEWFLEANDVAHSAKSSNQDAPNGIVKRRGTGFLGNKEDDPYGSTFNPDRLPEDPIDSNSFGMLRSNLMEERRMVNKIKSAILECIRREELEHSQTGFADMQPAVVSEEVKEVAPPGMEDVVLRLKKKFGAKSPRPFQIAWSMYNKKNGKKSSAKKKVNEGGSSWPPEEGDESWTAAQVDAETLERKNQEAEEWRAIYRRCREASRALNDVWPKMFDAMTKKEGIPGNKAMAKIRSMEKSIDNLAQDLQLFKNVAGVKKKATMAIGKNPGLAEFIPTEIGGKF